MIFTTTRERLNVSKEHHFPVNSRASDLSWSVYLLPCCHLGSFPSSQSSEISEYGLPCLLLSLLAGYILLWNSSVIIRRTLLKDLRMISPCYPSAETLKLICSSNLAKLTYQSRSNQSKMYYSNGDTTNRQQKSGKKRDLDLFSSYLCGGEPGFFSKDS